MNKIYTQLSIKLFKIIIKNLFSLGLSKWFPPFPVNSIPSRRIYPYFSYFSHKILGCIGPQFRAFYSTSPSPLSTVTINSTPDKIVFTDCQNNTSKSVMFILSLEALTTATRSLIENPNFMINGQIVREREKVLVEAPYKLISQITNIVYNLDKNYSYRFEFHVYTNITNKDIGAHLYAFDPDNKIVLNLVVGKQGYVSIVVIMVSEVNDDTVA